jgi:flagellar hook-associated protein 3 FlgL
MRITNSMPQRHVLADLQRVQQRLSEAQNQVSSGKRIEKPSDDPLGTARAMRLQSDLDTSSMYRTGVNESQSWLNATDAALSSLNDVVQHVGELTVQAANGSTSGDARKSIQTQIDQLTEEAKSILNQAYDGRYLFSGTKTDTPPYDPNSATPDAYQGDANPVLRQIGPGVTVQVNITGDDVLSGLLPALRTLSSDLANNDGTALSHDISTIDDGLKNLADKRAQVGAVTNRVTAAGTRLDDISDVTTKLLSDTQDADLPKALTDLAMQQNALQSALRGGSTLIQQSLMDFLQ